MTPPEIMKKFLELVDMGWKTEHILAYFWGTTSMSSLDLLTRNYGISIKATEYGPSALVKVEDSSGRTGVYHREHIDSLYRMYYMTK